MAENAEAIRRRELRRKKILENSDSRMMKLMGYDRTNSKDGIHPPKTLSDTTLDTSRLEQIKSTTHIIKGSPSSVSLPTGPNSSSSESTDISSILRCTSQETFARDLMPLLNLAEKIKPPPSAAVEKVNPTAWKDYIRLSIIVSLACLVRILQYLKITSVVKSIIIPFFLVEIGFISYDVVTDSKPGTSCASSLLSGALFLCGVSSSIVSNALRTLHYTTSFYNDLSFYLFTFFICHWLCESAI